MRYVVLKPLVFGGLSYEIGQEIDIFEKSIAENCLERELIGEVDKKTPPVETPDVPENDTPENQDETTPEEGEKTEGENVPEGETVPEEETEGENELEVTKTEGKKQNKAAKKQQK